MSIPTKKSFKVAVANQDNSTMLQLFAFQNGYGWIVKGHNDGKTIRNTNQEYIFSDTFLDIQATSQYSLFEELPYQEWEISDLITELSLGVSVTGNIIIRNNELYADIPNVIYRQNQTLTIIDPLQSIEENGVNYLKVNNTTS